MFKLAYLYINGYNARIPEYYKIIIIIAYIKAWLKEPTEIYNFMQLNGSNKIVKCVAPSLGNLTPTF